MIYLTFLLLLIHPATCTHVGNEVITIQKVEAPSMQKCEDVVQAFNSEIITTHDGHTITNAIICVQEI
jgi:hypothetical protein